ncbi:MAG: hypothetical protein ABIO70_05285 [Pseudomonadota bacterium]
MRSALLALVLLAACGEEKTDDTTTPDDTSPDTDTDTDADTDTDTDSDSDADSDSDTDHTFEPGDPVFEATFGGSTWAGEPGYWFSSASAGYIVGNQRSGEVQVNVEVLGDIRVAGTYDVGDIKYTDALQSAGYDFYFEGSGGATFTVLGHSADGEHLWGTFSGSVALTDTTGYQADTTLTGLELESWPKF